MMLRRNSTVARKKLIMVRILVQKEKRKTTTKKIIMKPGGTNRPLQSGLKLCSICLSDYTIHQSKAHFSTAEANIRGSNNDASPDADTVSRNPQKTENVAQSPPRLWLLW